MSHMELICCKYARSFYQERRIVCKISMEIRTCIVEASLHQWRRIDQYYAGFSVETRMRIVAESLSRIEFVEFICCKYMLFCIEKHTGFVAETLPH